MRLPLVRARALCTPPWRAPNLGLKNKTNAYAVRLKPGVSDQAAWGRFTARERVPRPHRSARLAGMRATWTSCWNVTWHLHTAMPGRQASARTGSKTPLLDLSACGKDAAMKAQSSFNLLSATERTPSSVRDDQSQVYSGIALHHHIYPRIVRPPLATKALHDAFGIKRSGSIITILYPLPPHDCADQTGCTTTAHSDVPPPAPRGAYSFVREPLIPTTTGAGRKR